MSWVWTKRAFPENYGDVIPEDITDFIPEDITDVILEDITDVIPEDITDVILEDYGDVIPEYLEDDGLRVVSWHGSNLSITVQTSGQRGNIREMAIQQNNCYINFNIQK